MPFAAWKQKWRCAARAMAGSSRRRYADARNVSWTGYAPVCARRAPGAAAKKQERGLNENYGREVMELHTVGVDAGYTQQDVIEMAKCLTGWTVREPRRDPEFFFDDRIPRAGQESRDGPTRSTTAARRTAKKR